MTEAIKTKDLFQTMAVMETSASYAMTGDILILFGTNSQRSKDQLIVSSFKSRLHCSLGSSISSIFHSLLIFSSLNAFVSFYVLLLILYVVFNALIFCKAL